MNELIQKSIEKIERQRCEWTIQDENAELSRILSDDLTFIHSNGIVHGKHAYLIFLKENVRTMTILRPEPPSIHMVNGAVLVIGPVNQTLERRSNGSRVEVCSFTSQLWMPTGCGYQLLHQQSTRRVE